MSYHRRIIACLGRLYGIAAAALLFACPTTVALAGPPAVDEAPATHIIQFRSNLGAQQTATAIANEYGLSLRSVYQHALQGMAAVVPAGRVRALQRDPRVLRVEENRRVRAFAQTLPTGINRINAVLHPTANIDGSDERVDVDVAVLDTGADLDHPDLNIHSYTHCARRGPSNTTCADNNSGADDSYGHGTHVSGTIAALDNDIGVVGVAPGARLWVVKVLDNQGSGYLNWVLAGIDYVTAHAFEIDVANMSLGFNGTSVILDTALANSVAAGVVYAVAAGNERLDVSQVSPGGHPDVITVSALADFDGQPGGFTDVTVGFSSCTERDDDSFGCFSNFGAGVDILAPGLLILSTWPGGGTNTISGTSMASPHVAGAAALYLADNPGSTPLEVKSTLVSLGDLLPCATPSGRCDDDPDNIQEPLLLACGDTDTDTDGVGDACDSDDDNDGLSDSFELSIGTDPLLVDTDGDGLTDLEEVAWDGDSGTYTPGLDLDPNDSDTDDDGHGDASDPIPLVFNDDDGDLAPAGASDGSVNAADYLIALQIATGQRAVTTHALAHGDLYPAGAPDGVINLQDVILLLKLVQQ